MAPDRAMDGSAARSSRADGACADPSCRGDPKRPVNARTREAAQPEKLGVEPPARPQKLAKTLRESWWPSWRRERRSLRESWRLVEHCYGLAVPLQAATS